MPGDRIVLERFDGYFGDKPDWQRATYKPITNDASRVAAVLSGDVDLISNVPGNDAVALKDNPKVALGTMASNRCYFWTLDVDRDASPQLTDMDGKPLSKNPLKDVRVRRAMSMAIDRGALVSRVMQGQAVAAAQFAMPASVPGTSAKLQAPGGVRSLRRREEAVGRGRDGAAVFGLTIPNSSNGPLSSNDAQVKSSVNSGTDVEPAWPEDHGGSDAEGDAYFPRVTKPEFSVLLSGNLYRHRRAAVAAAVSAGDLRCEEGHRRQQPRELFKLSASGRSPRQGGDDDG